jgi:flagellar biosynthesis protein FlhA
MEAFGNFVVGGNDLIGVVIFLVLVAIQFLVINHGAVRISECHGALHPGRHARHSIDSDLNAGLIDENEARTRRKQIASEAEFYGAMDGATRFTQRDAIASILITVINIVAGFLIGVLQHGMDLKKALETYTVLTIGDGLVTVIPALVISVSGGLIVTRTGSSETRLADTFRKQVLGDSQPLLLASGILVALAILPGMPKIPFMLLGGGVGWVGWRMRQKTGAAQAEPAAAPRPRRRPRKTSSRCSKWSRWLSRSVRVSSEWSKVARTRPCFGASPESASNSPANWATCCPPCPSPITFRSAPANTPSGLKVSS